MSMLPIILKKKKMMLASLLNPPSILPEGIITSENDEFILVTENGDYITIEN